VERYKMTWNVEGSDNLPGPDQPNAHLPQADVPSTDGGMEEDETEPARTSTGSRFTLSAGVHLGVVSPDVQRDIDALEKEGLKHPQAGYFGGRGKKKKSCLSPTYCFKSDSYRSTKKIAVQ